MKAVIGLVVGTLLGAFVGIFLDRRTDFFKEAVEAQIPADVRTQPIARPPEDGCNGWCLYEAENLMDASRQTGWGVAGMKRKEP